MPTQRRPRRPAPRRPLLPAGRLLHRPVAAGRSRRHHARARRPLAPRQRALPRRGAGRRRAAHAARRRSTCRRCRTARRSTTSACASACIPAGHVLGSAQVRLEHGGRVWVASGDYYVAGSERRRARGQPDLRAVRAGALPLLHHRVDLRPADLPLAAAGRAVRRHRRLVARATPTPAAPACSSATASARRSAS